MKKILLYLSAIIFLASCEDKIKIDLKEGESQLVVDAFLTNDPGEQLIKLRLTTNYFTPELPPATNAVVQVTDAIGRKFTFVDKNNTGNYIYTPGPFDFYPLGIQGNFYSLHILYKGEEFIGASYMDSVPPIDSIYAQSFEQELRGGDTIKAGYELNLIAKDKKGEGNAYWFKTYKNGKMFNRAEDMNLAYDGAFGPGSDGVQFIPPIIFNLIPDDSRLQPGDTATVELCSINVPTIYYLQLCQQQILNTGLFATPSVNVPSNIENKNKDSKIKALGWFATASISRVGIRIK